MNQAVLSLEYGKGSLDCALFSLNKRVCNIQEGPFVESSSPFVGLWLRFVGLSSIFVE
ncbi:hypothetical protein [Bacillus sp. PS06]|uniref:hypothetical protein n=1 Tax=Bacillus sp. PS06 TaxID=2764176 RepID=UPI0017817010|nr:hypothetical protein [Bacillus sp. PS06]MBD8071494.1 hypothetical protein [Bacillus sp. PS06]